MDNKWTNDVFQNGPVQSASPEGPGVETIFSPCRLKDVASQGFRVHPSVGHS